MMTREDVVVEWDPSDHDPKTCPICQGKFESQSDIKCEVDNKQEEMSETESKSVERTLSEEQQKREWEGDEDELPAIIQEADELREGMEEVAMRTNPDGTVEGIVKAIHMTKKNGTIAVDIDLPAESDPWRTHFTKPKAWTYNYEFVRFVEAYGQRASSITSMIEDGVRVKVRKAGGDYELVMPKTRKYWLSKIGNFHKGITKEDHLIWKAIPIGVGIYSMIYFGMPLQVWGPIDIILWVALGAVFAAGTALLEILFGEGVLGWGTE